MKVITIRQPYAHLISIGEKRVENRTRNTNYRGLIYIHAGKSWEYLDQAPKYNLTKDDMVFGAIIAKANLVASIDVNFIETYYFNYPWLEGHKHIQGPWCWILEDVKRVKPIYCNGQLGMWNYK
jgi:activating signal cointegrator 1